MPRKALIQMRRGTLAEWTGENPTLAAGEVGVAFDEDEDQIVLKIGDGTSPWNSLQFIGYNEWIGDVTGAGLGTGIITTIANDVVTDAKLANMNQGLMKGRADGAGTGDPTNLTAAQVMTILNSVLPNQSKATDTGATISSWPANGTYQALDSACQVDVTIGTWLVMTGVQGFVVYSAGTSAQINYRLRKTNGTPADVFTGEAVVSTTAQNDFRFSFSAKNVIYTASTTDTLAIQATRINATTWTSADVTGAFIVAVKLHD